MAGLSGPQLRGKWAYPPRKLGLKAVQTWNTSAIFLNHGKRSFRALPALPAAPRSPHQAERESLIQLLTSTIPEHSGGSRSAPSVHQEPGSERSSSRTRGTHLASDGPHVQRPRGLSRCSTPRCSSPATLPCAENISGSCLRPRSVPLHQ